MIFTYDEKNMLTVFDTGFSRKQVRKNIPLPFQEFMKTEFCKNSSDMFGESNILVTYCENNMLSEVELYKGKIKLFFLERNLLDMKLSEVKAFLDKMCIKYLIDEYGLVIINYGIELYIPDIESQKAAVIESVCLKR